MTNQRLAHIRQQALALHKRINIATTKQYRRKKWIEAQQAWEPYGDVITVKMPPQTWLRRNNLVRVTLKEHQWLTANRPGIAVYTRCFNYADNIFIENTNLMGSSRPPTVREFWVGARTLSTIGEDEVPEGFRKAQADQEDQAELTELMTILYHDPKTGVPMIEDYNTGEYRPVRPGDTVTIVRKSNDDLDALFLEEGDDPRQQNDFSAEGSDHTWSDRFRANTDQEQEFLNSRFCQTRTASCNKPMARGQSHIIPNSALPEGAEWSPNDLEIRRLAQAQVQRLIDRIPLMESNRAALTDEAEQQLQRMFGELKFSHDGVLTHGYFVTRAEFFACLEENRLNRKNPVKGAPQPMDWDVIRGKKKSPVVKRAKSSAPANQVP